MKRTAMALVILASSLMITSLARPARAQTPVQFKTSDGVTIYGAYYEAKNAKEPVILLFHQGGANRYEYASIAPRLAAEGFTCLAIDQRWGGMMWGHSNETVKKLGHGESDASNVAGLEADLEAALTWAQKKDPGRKFILWGSSYSASLVFVIAARHPAEVAGVLAFSPGEYFRNPTMVRDAAAKVLVPVFITSENEAANLAYATQVFDAVGSRHKVHYSAKYAVHGSSTLLADRNPKGAAVTWQVVMKFLTQFEE